MTKRKETPDILAEILGGDELPPAEVQPTTRNAPVRPAVRAPRSASTESEPARKPATSPTAPARAGIGIPAGVLPVPPRLSGRASTTARSWMIGWMARPCTSISNS